MYRIILLIGIVVAVFIFMKFVLPSSSYNKCTNCDGQGYWRGTRGDKNSCKTCGGTGRID